MIINKTGSTGASSDVKKKGKTSSGGNFAAHLDAGDSEVTSATGVSGPSMINSLFMLQEVDNDSLSKKQAVEDGHDALKYLDKIRLGLLTGTVSSNMLNSLNTLIKQWRKNFDDPHLESIIDEIELRAAVELAKLENI
jgi:hypothetical protein